MFRPFRPVPLLLALASVVLLSGLSGCGGSRGPERYRVWGKVTFNGKPVPVGSIKFDPAKGNDGPQGSAAIKDGKYDTAAQGGAGVVGGPHVVRISGFTGVAANDDAPQGPPLFPQYKQSVDLPKESVEKDFDVPSSPAP